MTDKTKGDQAAKKNLNRVLIEVELSESISGNKPPIVPRNISHKAVIGTTCPADNNAVAAKLLVSAADPRCILKLATIIHTEQGR